jgi:hypothetical protein
MNSSRAKIEALHRRYPDLADPATVSVGMSDTGYGEDHGWARHFTRVVDVNSTAPFPPIVAAGSPLREIHSAVVLTRAERARRSAGGERWLDPRRQPRSEGGRTFGAGELSAALGDLTAAVEELARSRADVEERLAPALAPLAQRVGAELARIDELARAFNEGDPRARRAALAELRRALRRKRQLRRALVRVERPLSEIAFRMAKELTRSRALLATAASTGAQVLDAA